jgi:hypothetical protein
MSASGFSLIDIFGISCAWKELKESEKEKMTLVFRRLHTLVCSAYLDPWRAGVCSVCFG